MNKYLKILFLLTIAYFISEFSIKNIFLANSPEFNPNAGEEMLAKANFYWSKSTSMLAFSNIFPASTNTSGNNNNGSSNNNLAKNNTSNSQINNWFQPKNPTIIPTNGPTNNGGSISDDIKEALTASLSKVTQGVYAGEKNDVKVYEVRTNEIEYLEYVFNINGKEIKIKVPKDQTKPTQAEMEALFK